MKYKFHLMVFCRVAVCGLTTALLLGCSGGPRPAGSPAEDGQYQVLAREVFEETNRLRANPRAYGQYLKEIAGRMKGKVYYPAGSSVGIVTSEGVAAVEEAIAVLDRQRPLPLLKWSEALARLAREHVADTGPKGLTRHEDSAGRGFAERVSQLAERERFAYMAENLSFGYSNARDVVAQWVIDDGVPGRGHRRNILKQRLNYSGVACGYHAQYRQMCDAVYAYRE